MVNVLEGTFPCFLGCKCKGGEVVLSNLQSPIMVNLQVSRINLASHISGLHTRRTLYGIHQFGSLVCTPFFVF